MPKNFRRVVTGHRIEDGKSFIWKDGAPPQSLEPMPELILHEIWETGSKANNSGERDTARSAKTVLNLTIPLGRFLGLLNFHLTKFGWLAT